jgi:hypothetical protein
MKAILTALAALAVGAAFAAATGSSLAAGSLDDFLKVAVIGQGTGATRPVHAAVPELGYIVYAGDTAALPAPSCYWARMPVYDFDHNVIGWRGRPVPICP